VKLEGNGSLIIFEKDAYTHYCHSIQDYDMSTMEETVAVTEEEEQQQQDVLMNCSVGDTIQRGYRLSLTFRHKFQS